MWPDNQIVLILQTIGPVGKMRCLLLAEVDMG